MNHKIISIDYTKLIGRNSEEKLKFWKKFLKSDRKNINILEIGIGGGETLKGIKKLCSKSELLYAIDTEKKFVRIGEDIIGSNSILANACKLPFKNNFFRVINISSLLHEVSSYGYINKRKHIVGLETLRVALSEIIRVLEENGFLYYRDILAPKKRMCRNVKYYPVSIRFFIDLFLKKFINTEPYFYRNKYILRKENNCYVL